MTEAIKWSTLVNKASNDPNFKDALLEDPRYAIEELTGMKLPAEVQFFVHEQTPQEVHLVLPLTTQSSKGDKAVFLEPDDESAKPDKAVFLEPDDTKGKPDKAVFLEPDDATAKPDKAVFLEPDDPKDKPDKAVFLEPDDGDTDAK